MRIALGRLHRRSDENEQEAGVTGSDDHGSRAGDKRRERQEAQLQAKRELGGDPRSPGAWNVPGSGF